MSPAHATVRLRICEAECGWDCGRNSRATRAASALHHHRADLAGEQPSDEPWHPHRLLGAERLREPRQLLTDKAGIIVDHELARWNLLVCR
jgi:hypothetical protein